MKSSRTAAVIVTFNPDLALLRELVDGLVAQCRIWLVDNGSQTSRSHQIEAMAHTTEGVALLLLGSNMGIAAAQNRGIEAALAYVPDLEFILTLDHDSSVSEEMIGALETMYDLQSATSLVAAVGPLLFDPRAEVPIAFHTRKGLWIRRRLRGVGNDPLEVDTLNSSGSLIACEALRKVGLFDETFFIDHVETEWCFRVKAAGYRLYGCPQVRMVHRMGDDARAFWFFGSRVWPERSPARHYYIFRNSFFLQRLAYVPRSWKLWNIVKLILTFAIFGFIGDKANDQRREMCRGFKEGVRGSCAACIRTML